MLPVTHGPQFTRLHILLYTLLLVATTALPTLVGMSGVVYLVSALLLGGYFLWLAWCLYRSYSERLARKTFKYSINYLALLFAALLLDHYLL
jgi:protoheme IX farnesyltransferase